MCCERSNIEKFTTPNLDKQPKHKVEAQHYDWRVGSTQNIQRSMGPFGNTRKGALCFLFATRTYRR